jgi:hypothetical protein
MVAYPVAAVAFWSMFLGWPVFLGGAIALVLALGFWWAMTNIGTYLCSPRYYKLWKSGGGDPFFDTVDWPFNSDPNEVRFQELFREQARQETVAVNRQFGLPPDFMTGNGPVPPPASVPDATFGLDDPHLL